MYSSLYYTKILFPVSNRGVASWRIDTEFLCKEQSTLQHFFEMVQGHTQNRGKGRRQPLRIGKRTMRSIRFHSASIAFSSSYNDTEHQICMAHAMAKLAKDEMERTIRKLTTQRNNTLHYGSDEGVEMVVAYHSVISTVKLYGMSSWRYLDEFFKKIFNGCRGFFSLTPANIGMSMPNIVQMSIKSSLLVFIECSRYSNINC